MARGRRLGAVIGLALWGTACGDGPFDAYWIGGQGTLYAHDDMAIAWSITDSFVNGARIQYTTVGFYDVHGNGEPVAWANVDGFDYAGPSIDPRGFVLVPSGGGLTWLTDTGIQMTAHDGSGANLSTSPAIGPGGRVYVGTEAGEVVCIDPDQGLQWVAETPGTPFNRLAIGADGVIFGFAAVQDEAGVVSWTAFALDPDGATRWETPMGVPYGSPAISQRGELLASVRVGPEDVVIANPDDYRLVAYDPADGAVAWEGVMGLPAYSPVVLPNGDIVVAMNDEGAQTGFIGVFNDRNGNQRARSGELGWLGQPAIGGDGRIYVGCGAGEVCVLTSGGAVRKRYGGEDYEGGDFLKPPLLHQGWLMIDGLGAMRLGGGLGLAEGTWARNGHDARNSGWVGEE